MVNAIEKQQVGSDVQVLRLDRLEVQLARAIRRARIDSMTITRAIRGQTEFEFGKETLRILIPQQAEPIEVFNL